MEQFKQLKWSWNKYEEEKNHSPRVFNFDTISNSDVLTRTLNEIHKCVLPKNDEYQLFKTSEEIAACTSELGSQTALEVKDPRKNPTRLFKKSHELIKDYGYSSELKAQEQKMVMSSLKLRIIHNPSLIHQSQRELNSKCRQEASSSNLNQGEFLAKHKTESAHFNKVAEIFFYRNANEFNDLINPEMKSFLINRWNNLENQVDERKFQVITMLLRDQVYDGKPQVDSISAKDNGFNREAYLIREDKFPSLDRFTAEDLKFYCNLKDSRRLDVDPETNNDVVLSIDLLSRLLVDTEEFTVRFENVEKINGSLLSSFYNPLPLKPVSISTSIEEIVKSLLCLSFDWDNIDRLGAKPASLSTDPTSMKATKEFHARKIEEVIKKIYTSHQSKEGVNETIRTWKVSNGQQEFLFSVNQQNSYFSKEDDSTLLPVNISIKLEFQTKFGAERMTRRELLGEWCAMKFISTTKNLRYRIDVMTLKIVSITRISIEEVEKELIEIYTTDPNELIGNLVNLFSCVHRLPRDDYMMISKLENDCKKLFIYKASEQGKFLTDEPWEISSVSSQKWLPIDEHTPTFVHLNHHFPPGCFPIGNKKRPSSSYKVESLCKKPKALRKVNNSGGFVKKTFEGNQKAPEKKPTVVTKKPRPARKKPSKRIQQRMKMNQKKNMNKS